MFSISLSLTYALAGKQLSLEEAVLLVLKHGECRFRIRCTTTDRVAFFWLYLRVSWILAALVLIPTSLAAPVDLDRRAGDITGLLLLLAVLPLLCIADGKV